MLLQNKGGVVDHAVGAGKTLVMAMAAMEMRRLGIARKPMIIGMKATMQQLASTIREAYPHANTSLVLP